MGVSIAIFNQASKVTIFPLVSITTSFVAEEDTIGRLEKEMQINEMIKVKAEDVVLDSLEKGGSATNMQTQEVKAENTTMSVLATSASETSAFKPQNVDCCDSVKSQTKAKKHQSTDSQTNVARVKRHIPSASTALVMGAVLGILQTIFLISLARPLLGIMGVRSVSTSRIFHALKLIIFNQFKDQT